MKITYDFSSLKDLSDVSNAEKLLKILTSNGLIIDKAGGHEPIRKEFNVNNLHELWGYIRTDGRCSSNYFLFKGKREIRFSGMATWNLNLHPNNGSFNGLALWLSTPPKYDIKKLIQLGDDIFEWCEAVYGYITESISDPYSDIDNMPGNIYEGIPSLMWVNYFGYPYIMEPDFNIPDNYVSVNHGMRLNLTETPNDERLRDQTFLQSCVNKIGDEWFWHKHRRCNTRIPNFDKSEITRQ